ncbi:hypothetical protein VTL71DRAFT_12657, partial [Oculimacula yallundae]
MQRDKDYDQEKGGNIYRRTQFIPPLKNCPGDVSKILCENIAHLISYHLIAPNLNSPVGESRQILKILPGPRSTPQIQDRTD